MLKLQFRVELYRRVWYYHLSMKQKGSIKKTRLDISVHRSAQSGFFEASEGYLYLADGTKYSGKIPVGQATGKGEVVFNTGMTGYIESLTDPSYTDQILVFTYPLIGNYGVDLRKSESGHIQVAGVVVSELTEHWSHTGSDRSLLEWLQTENIPVITDVDTRALTKHLRVNGTMAGAIATDPVHEFDLLERIVSIDAPKTYNKQHAKKVILVDCGTKENIVRSLCALPVQVKRVPYDYDYTNEQYDGVLISNGPGNPEHYEATISIARKAMILGKPIFGICLGNQIMGLAAGASTYKLVFGHRGHNQPCLDVKANHAYITSQNHGYAIDDTSLPRGWVTSFRNLNDGSVEGIEHTSKPFFAVQFHPEACAGPTDTAWLFERFYKCL